MISAERCPDSTYSKLFLPVVASFLVLSVIIFFGFLFQTSAMGIKTSYCLQSLSAHFYYVWHWCMNLLLFCFFLFIFSLVLKCGIMVSCHPKVHFVSVCVCLLFCFSLIYDPVTFSVNGAVICTCWSCAILDIHHICTNALDACLDPYGPVQSYCLQVYGLMFSVQTSLITIIRDLRWSPMHSLRLSIHT